MNRARAGWIAAGLALVLAGCAEGDGRPDVGLPDAGVNAADAGLGDAAGPVDGGPPDVGGAADAGGPRDAGAPTDATTPDTAGLDAGEARDSGLADAAVPDAGSPADADVVEDAGSSRDAGSLADAGSLPDAGPSADAGVDPCRGVPNRCSTAGRSCAGDQLLDCAPDPNGCLVQTVTDCTGIGAICDPAGLAQCRFVPCPAARTVLDCSSGSFPIDTAMGGDFFSGNACDSANSYAPAEVAFSFVPATDVLLMVEVTGASVGPTDFNLFLLAGETNPNTCDDTSPCRGADISPGRNSSLVATLPAGSLTYILYDALGAQPGPTATATMRITCLP